MAKKKAAEFPSALYVAYEYEGMRKFFIAKDDMTDHADLAGDTRVAVYKLEEIVTVKVNVESVPD